MKNEKKKQEKSNNANKYRNFHSFYEKKIISCCKAFRKTS